MKYVLTTLTILVTLSTTVNAQKLTTQEMVDALKECQKTVQRLQMKDSKGRFLVCKTG